MARYIKKPTEYEACQLTKEIVMTDWLRSAVNSGEVMFSISDESGEIFATIQRKEITDLGNDNFVNYVVNFGDYIVYDPDLGIIGYTKDYFESHYERIDIL